MEPCDYIGKKVRFYSTDGETNSLEYGIIVNAWHDDFLKIIDCYVAMYEVGIHYGENGYRPGILHYAADSLELI